MSGAVSYEGLLLPPMPSLTMTGPERNTMKVEAISPARSHFELSTEGARGEGGGGHLSASPPSYPLAHKEHCSFAPLLKASLRSLFPFHTHTCTPYTD